jgi:endonuclease/exonuclease/phosphatase family metal-dependent hydrolase
MICLASGLALAAAGQPPPPASQAARILVDGRFDDWQGVPVAHADPVDADEGLDFGRLWIANDEHYLFLRLELGREIVIQDGNELVLYLDGDDDPGTGHRVHGLGAELEWHFGHRQGTLYAGPVILPVDHDQIGLISSPTYSAAEFEIVLDRNAWPRPEIPLFSGESCRVAFADDRPGHDVIPDAPGGVAHRFDDAPLPEIPAISLDKQDPRHVRVLSYNLNDRLGDPARKAALRRIFGALRPDLILLQEVRSWTEAQAEDYVRGTLGAAPPFGERWHAAQSGTENNVVLSPYPIAEVHPLGGSAAVVLSLDPAADRKLLVVVLSAPCCAKDDERQLEIDSIMAFLRDAETPGGDVTVPPRTPIALIGDANLVGSARQLRTLLDGDVAHRDRYGQPFAPDWDGTSLTDLKPRHTHRLLTYTWQGPDFSPGRLDVALLADSVLAAGNRFVLFTPDMPPDFLDRHGLERQDVLTASDHLPVVVDLVLPSEASASPR